MCDTKFSFPVEIITELCKALTVFFTCVPKMTSYTQHTAVGYVMGLPCL